jgi:hypothetical protein
MDDVAVCNCTAKIKYGADGFDWKYKVCLGKRVCPKCGLYFWYEDTTQEPED